MGIFQTSDLQEVFFKIEGKKQTSNTVLWTVLDQKND